MSTVAGITRRTLLGIATIIPAMLAVSDRDSGDSTSGGEERVIPLQSPWPTKLDSFLKLNAIKVFRLARDAGFSRELLWDLCLGRAVPTIRQALRLRAACQRFVHRPVPLSELFDLHVPLRHSWRVKAKPLISTVI